MSEKTITPWKNGEAQESKSDILSDEEPLQIIINGHSVAVLMRTPGA